MNIEMSVLLAMSLIGFAFICEYMDSTLGMGYGTTLTPTLLIIGFEPMQIVPVVLISELISGVLAAIYHHKEGNVNLKPRSTQLSVIRASIKRWGLAHCVRHGLPTDLKVALILATCSILGTIAAVFIALNIPTMWVKWYIGVLVLSMGITILVCFNKRYAFSWTKICGLGLLASFNKGVSGGGYGPVVTSGQILSGVEGKSAVGITSLAEGLTCAVGIVAYGVIAKHPLDLQLAPFLICGAALSVPLSAKSVKHLTANRLKLAIAVLTVALGLWTIGKVCLR